MADHVSLGKLLHGYDLGLATKLLSDDAPLTRFISHLDAINTILHQGGFSHETFAQDLYNELKAHPLYVDEAVAFTDYARDRFARHTEGTTYKPSYLENDKTLFGVPGQIVKLNLPLEKRVQQVQTFFKLAKSVQSIRDFNGATFSEIFPRELGHLEYVDGLSEDRKQTLIAVEECGGLWDQYEDKIIQESNAPSKEAWAYQESGRLDVLKGYQKQHNMNLLEYSRFLRSNPLKK